jgi:drug/metabolite transporter (DMT)-like permease
MRAPMSAMDRPAVLAGFVVLLCLIWGSTWFAIRVGLESLPPFFSAALRYVIAAGIVAGLAIGQGIRPPAGRRLHAALLALGFLAFALSFGAVYWGEQFVPGGLAAVIFATHPLLVSLVSSRALSDEPLTARKLAGILVGFSGVAVLMLDDVALDHPLAPVGAAVILISPITAAVVNVGVKRFGTGLHVFNLTALPMFYGGVTLLGVSLLAEDWDGIAWTPSGVASVLYLAIFGSTIAVVAYYSLLKRLPVSRLALMSYAFPVVAVVIDVLIAGERFGTRAWLGSALVLAGVVVAGVRRRAAVPPVSGSPTGRTQ